MRSDKVISTGYFYYKDIPIVLDCYISKDAFCEMNKDGAHTVNGISCPRSTIVVYSVGDVRKDQKRIGQLDKIFMELLANNQIMSYSLPGVQSGV